MLARRISVSHGPCSLDEGDCRQNGERFSPTRSLRRLPDCEGFFDGAQPGAKGGRQFAKCALDALLGEELAYRFHSGDACQFLDLPRLFRAGSLTLRSARSCMSSMPLLGSMARRMEA